MPIEATGPLSLNTDIVGEFGGEKPHSLSEYYRGGARVPNVTANAKVPLVNNPISFSDFRGAVNVLTVSYEIIGGGGGGGAGRSDDIDRDKALYIQPGGTSFIRLGTQNLVSAAGGRGGVSFAYRYDDSRGAGQSSPYGSGGARGANKSSGGNASTSSYGAGGGGGGGDSPSRYDSSGNRGAGGLAGTFRSGTLNIAPGSTLSIIIGGRGTGHKTIHQGGNGAAGFAKITIDGTVYTFTSSGSLVV